MLTKGPNDMGRFGHHENPALDFVREVDHIAAMQRAVCDRRESEAKLEARIARALDFRVGGDIRAIEAKARLREIAGEDDYLGSPSRLSRGWIA